MKTWFQTDKELSPIREWGCLIISMVNLDQLVSEKEYTAKQILELWIKNYQEKDIDIESTVLDHNGVMEDLSGMLIFLGKYDKNYLPALGEYEILEYYNPKTEIVHFVVGDGKGKCLIDPYLNSNTVKNGYVRSKRIYKLKEKV